VQDNRITWTGDLTRIMREGTLEEQEAAGLVEVYED
jgi:hypothetical protein